MIVLLKSTYQRIISFLYSFTQQTARILQLQHQLSIYQRQQPKPLIKNSDRIYLILLSKLNKFWKSDLFVAKPETLIKWHRNLCKLFWAWKSRAGRKRITLKIRLLIKQMHDENSTWGAKRIHDELCLLGYKDKVSETSVKNYLKRLGPRPKGKISKQTWMTFLKNMLKFTCACDFFTVTTVNFKTLYCFVILSHDKRKILYTNVTKHPSLEWTKQQFREAFPFAHPHKYIVRDRDSIYGSHFKYFIESFGMKDKMTSYKSPWQNCYCERVIGTIRRECTDHCMFRSENHLRDVLKEYVHYYNHIRPHQSLNGNAPVNRKTQKEKDGNIVSVPVLNGLHHHYFRKAA